MISLQPIHIYRLGFAADSYPRFIIPTEIYDVEKKTSKKLFDYQSRTQLYEHMVEFIQKLFFKYAFAVVTIMIRQRFLVFHFACHAILQICASQPERTESGDRRECFMSY